MCKQSLLFVLLSLGVLQAHGAVIKAPVPLPTNDLAAPAVDAPDNDLCTNVVPMPLAVGGPLTFVGDNTEATFAGDAVPGSLLDEYPFPDTWHAFTTTECANVTVSYCTTDSGWSNVWRLLTTQCPADEVIQSSTSETTTCANGNWTFTFNQLAPGTYYLPVPNVGFGQGGGPYNIEVSAVTCGNDHCGDIMPQSLPVGTTLNFIGDNTAATYAGDAVSGSLLDEFPFANTWHAFTTTECANVTVSYCATDSGWSNVWRLLTTQCPADAVIQSSTSETTTCANGNWTFTFNQLAPGTYYLPVPNVGFGQGGGPYNVEVSAVTCGNDHCGDIIPQSLLVGTTLNFIGDNTNATFAGDAVPGNLLEQYPFPNNWHAFTTTECAKVTISYCATDSGWSNVWRLLTVQCPADSLIYPSSTDTTMCVNGNWTFTFNELAAGTYSLPVPNVGFGQGGGPYNIEVSAVLCANTPPANDLCSDVAPTELAVDSMLTFSGDNTNATFAGDAAPGTIMAQYPSPNTWHAFSTTECTNVTVSYCAMDSGWSNVWRLLTALCPADSLINASSSDTTTCANGNWTFTFDELAPGTYYLPVPNVGFGQGGGAYTIEVSAVLCANLPPANDLCADVTAVALAVDSTLTFSGDNTNATFAGDAAPGTILDQYPFPNTWHAFTVSECADVSVSYCATDSGWSNVWQLLTTDCPADSIINVYGADTTSCSNGNWTFSFHQLQPGTYYLPVPNTGFGQGGGAYSIDVSAAACVPDHVMDVNSSGDWSVFPNPTNGEVTIIAPRDMGTATLEMIDMTGRTMYRTQLVMTAGNSHQLSLARHVAPGTYALRMTTANGRSTQLLILK